MLLKQDNTELIFSCLSGYNFYEISDPIIENEQSTGKIRAVHVLNGTEVEIRDDKVLSKINTAKKWRYFVEHPVDITKILWPVDIVSRDDNEQLGLVFRRRAFPPLKTFREILYNDVLLDWRKEKTQALARNFLELCVCLHGGGYAYHCYMMDRMWYNPEDMSILFDFSMSMTRTNNNLECTESIPSDEVGIEFMPPWLDLDKNNDMSLIDDYYSITALLFRMMIGRMPYQGRLMDGNGDMMNLLRDIDENNHLNMFKQYRSNPIFIFDPEDKRNEIGLFSSEDKFIERWDDLDDEIKTMFIEALSYNNVKKECEKRICYSPQEWLDVLNKHCFKTE